MNGKRLMRALGADLGLLWSLSRIGGMKRSWQWSWSMLQELWGGFIGRTRQDTEEEAQPQPHDAKSRKRAWMLWLCCAGVLWAFGVLLAWQVLDSDSIWQVLHYAVASLCCFLTGGCWLLRAWRDG